MRVAMMVGDRGGGDSDGSGGNVILIVADSCG